MITPNATISTTSSRKSQRSPSYLDTYDKSRNFSEGRSCGRFCKVGRCSHCGAKYLKVLFCGKEWCEHCREYMHRRRQARLLPKVLTMDRAGYFVFTMPEHVRKYFVDQDHLNQLRRYLRDKLKRLLPELLPGSNNLRAITRWHWFGDEDLVKYHPHLNILVADIQRIDPGVLASLKEDYRRCLERLTGKPVPKVVVYYHYLKNREEIFHKVRYITRPTFLKYEGNEQLAHHLKGYHTGTIWGTWEQPEPEVIRQFIASIPKKERRELSPELVALLNDTCPVCGSRITWDSGVYNSNWLIQASEPLGEGYYCLEQAVSP